MGPIDELVSILMAVGSAREAATPPPHLAPGLTRRARRAP